jgi:hypothetical protein
MAKHHPGEPSASWLALGVILERGTACGLVSVRNDQQLGLTWGDSLVVGG